jgi:hypothetical protein
MCRQTLRVWPDGKHQGRVALVEHSRRDRPIYLTDLRVIDDGFDRRAREVQCVHWQYAQDAVPLEQPHRPKKLLEALSAVPGQGAAGEEIVVGGLISKDECSRLLRTSTVNRALTQRVVRGDSKRRKVWPCESWLTAHHQTGERGRWAAIKSDERRPWRLIRAIAWLLRVPFRGAVSVIWISNRGGVFAFLREHLNSTLIVLTVAGGAALANPPTRHERAKWRCPLEG